MPKMSDRLIKGVELYGPFGDKKRPLIDLIQEVERNREVIKMLIGIMPRCLSESTRKRLIRKLDEV